MSTLPMTNNTPLVTTSQPHAKMDNDNFSWLTGMGFAFLTFNSGMAIYRSKGDAGSVAFVAVSYLDLLLLFCCLRLYEQSSNNPSQRKIIKGIVWFLTTLLTAMFSYKVAALMPLPVAVIVWAMASATILGGFYAFFLHQEVPPVPNKQQILH